ncbi:uncharacterized protein LOC106673964 isoform X2 [Cimex lectularius]|nr:uncharacterized protein LOC106673964 isoform X2 [Cimex lectularius]XP_024085679.1 uncharacterized protein LOC106673964 isoform X2 [Cimex lectularius]
MQMALVLLAVVGHILAADPEAPRIHGQQKLATAADCSGAVGFSGVGTHQVHDTGLIGYRTTLVDRGVGFSRETGEFTVHCPGIYHIAFAAYSNTPNTRIILKKRGAGKGSTWTEVASAGGEKSGGGSNQILLELEVGDQTGVWLADRRVNIATDNDRAAPSTTFTAFRIAKK